MIVFGIHEDLNIHAKDTVAFNILLTRFQQIFQVLMNLYNVPKFHIENCALRLLNRVRNYSWYIKKL